MANSQTYSMDCRLNSSYEESVDAVVKALKDEGFGVLTEIDVKKTMKEKLDADFRKYVILGACNPPLAHKALTTDLQLGLLLPCNAIVYEDDDGCAVSIIDPAMMTQIADNEALNEVATEARSRLERVVAKLQE